VRLEFNGHDHGKSKPYYFTGKSQWCGITVNGSQAMDL